MGWVTLTLRRETLDIEGNNLEFRDTQLSRRLRNVQKNLSHDQSVFNKNKHAELAKAKKPYEEVKARKGDNMEYGSDEYNQWYQELADAKEKYEAEKLDIENRYDDMNNEAEEESTDKENEIKDEQVNVESQLESNKSELEVVKQQISTDIDQSKLNLK